MTPPELPEDLRPIARLADATADMITVADQAGTIVFISRGCERMLGFKPEELVGRNLFAQLHPDDAARTRADLDQRVQTGEPTEARAIRADGSYRWLESRSWPHTIGGELFVVSIGRDIHLRKATESAIRLANQALATQADASPDGVLVVDREGRVVSWNKRLPELLEVDERLLQVGDLAELTQAFSERLVDPEAYRSAVAAPRETTTTVRLELYSGRVLDRTRIAPADPARAPGANVVILYRDVTSQARTERELKVRSAQQSAVAALSQLALAAPAPVHFFGEAVRLCTEALALDVCGIFELQGDVLLHRAGTGNALPDGERSAMDKRAFSAAVIAGGVSQTVEDWQTETRFQAAMLREMGMRSGACVPVLRSGKPGGTISAHRKKLQAFDEQDLACLQSMANVVASFLDRQESDAALRRSTEGFRALIEVAPDLILVHRDGLIVYGNAAARALVGAADVSALIGRPLSSLARSEDGPAERQPGDEPRSSWHGPARQIRIVCTDGSERLHEVASLPVSFDGQPATISFGRDVTERRELQLRLQLADRMASVGTLAAGVAHELNNPLAYVMANLQFLGDELRSFEPHLDQTPVAPRLRAAEEALREARDGASRLRVIVRDLSTFSRGEGEAKRPVDLRPVIESSLNMALNQIRNRATVVRDLLPVPRVFGNAARLGQVALNLLVNAAQAIPEGDAAGHRIEVRTRFEGGLVRFEVSDTGGGIPAHLLGRIFDPFFTTKAPGLGTGLGLSISHSIVTSMGGRIEVDSAPGKGTTFRVLLPPTDEISVPPPPPEPVQPAPQRVRARLLVVDDEPLVGLALRRALSKEHDVTVLQGGRPALERLLAGDRFDALISDLLMPDCTGMDLYEALLVQQPALARRTLFLTGGAFTESAREFLERPGIRSLEKPFDVEVLRVTVRSLLGEP